MHLRVTVIKTSLMCLVRIYELLIPGALFREWCQKIKEVHIIKLVCQNAEFFSQFLSIKKQTFASVQCNIIQSSSSAVNETVIKVFFNLLMTTGANFTC